MGIHNIDLTLVEHNGVYYGFHKPGGVEDLMGIRLSVSRSLSPHDEGFSFGKAGPGREFLPDQSKPIEGPEVIKLIGQKKWLVYADPFHHPMEAWETTDLVNFSKVAVSVSEGAKHCSMLPITKAELQKLFAEYPNGQK